MCSESICIRPEQTYKRVRNSDPVTPVKARRLTPGFTSLVKPLMKNAGVKME